MNEENLHEQLKSSWVLLFLPEELNHKISIFLSNTNLSFEDKDKFIEIIEQVHLSGRLREYVPHNEELRD